MLKKAISAIVFLSACLWLPAAAAVEIPDWLRVTAKQPARAYADDVNAVVLLDDQTTTVKENGEIVNQGRRIIKILRAEGRRLADFEVHYRSDSKVNYLHGWSITSKGQEYEAKDISERSVSSYEVYADIKAKMIHVPGGDVGTVVGFEYEQQSRPYIFQDFWDFQSFWPVEKSRYRLHLGSGWRFKAEWLNHEENKPTEEKGDLVWQLSDIPRIELEPHRPPSDALAGLMVVTFLSDKAPDKTYQNWPEFASWYSRLSSGVRDSTPALQQKVKDLAPATQSPMERIQALAHFAQHDVRYVEISIGIGGWRPHAAGDILGNKYGDCKDKATVLSSMLTQIGVKSYYVLVNTERGTFKANSPPQARFDHMILAIALPDASYGKSMPAVYEHPALGHLLIFDPTNEHVPFGQIPFYEQDNYGLLVGEQGGELIHLPLSSPESNGVRRISRLKLLPDGSLQGDVEEVHSGFMAMAARGVLQHETDSDRKKLIERFVGGNLSNVQVDNLELVNANDTDKDLIIRYKITADHYAKTVGALLLVRPRVLGELAGGWDPNKPRHYAYDFPAPFLSSDQVEISLPDGFKVDELPDPAKASFPFGTYTSSAENVGNILKYHREYRVTTTQVPFERISDLAKLFSSINIDEKAQAVLKKN